MERNAPEEIIPALLTVLHAGAQSLTEISKTSKINRITAAKYLKALEKGKAVVSKKEGRETIYGLANNTNNHFRLPVTKEQRKKFNTYYYHIKNFCEEKFDTKPTRTQAYKVLWTLNKQLDLKLPIGWYKYGQCADQSFQGNENAEYDLNPAELHQVKEVTEAYCGLSNQELQTKIYKESKDQLYITKNTLLLEINEKNINGEDREWFRQTLRNLIKYSPREAFDIVNDFANTSLLVDWKIMGSIFKEVWDYVALIRNKETPNRAFPELSEARINEHIERIEEIVRQHLKEAMEHVHINTLEDFKKAISVWGDQPDNIPTRTKEERKQLHKDFLKNKKRSDVFKNVGL
jgi:predicted transcriptional regulator